MPTMQIRNVPEATSRVLKARASAAGLSLSDYLLRELTNLSERPSLDELEARLKLRGRTPGLPSTAEVLREGRVDR